MFFWVFLKQRIRDAIGEENMSKIKVYQIKSFKIRKKDRSIIFITIVIVS